MLPCAVKNLKRGGIYVAPCREVGSAPEEALSRSMDRHSYPQPPAKGIWRSSYQTEGRRSQQVARGHRRRVADRAEGRYARGSSGCEEGRSKPHRHAHIRRLRPDACLPNALEQSAASPSFGGIAIGRLTSRLTAPHPEMQDRRQTASPWYRVTCPRLRLSASR